RSSASRLIEIATLAGGDQLVERTDLVVEPAVVAPVFVLREAQRLERVAETHAFGDCVFHGRVFIRDHRSEFLDVLAGRYVAVARQNWVDVQGGNLVEQREPVLD